MELVDKFDNKRVPLGKKTDRYEKVNGEFNQSVHVWFLNDNNELLIQKRSMTKRVYPGMWSITGGAVDSGEAPIHALFREIKEELGIEANPNNTELLLSIQRRTDFVDIYLVRQNINLEDIRIQEEELSEVKYVSIDEFKELLETKEIPSGVSMYADFALELIERRINGNW